MNRPPSPRIASLLASSTEILFALGLGDQVVAISHECDYPPEASDRPRVTTTLVDASRASSEIDAQVRAAAETHQPLYALDLPLLAELRPDLIVTQAQCDVCAVRYDDVIAAVRSEPALRDTRVIALNPRSLADILDDIRRVGRAVGREVAADEFVARLQRRVDAVRTVSADLPPVRRPRVLCIEWTDPLMVSGNWLPELIELAGGHGYIRTYGAHSACTEWADLAAWQPEVIVIMPCGFDLARASAEALTLVHLPGWADLPAIRTGRVYAADGNALFNRSGPRIVDSLEVLAHLVRPDRFPAAPPVDAVRQLH